MRAFAELVSTLLVSTHLVAGYRIAKRRTEAKELVEIVPESWEQVREFVKMPEFSDDDWESLTLEQMLVWTTKGTRAALENAGFNYSHLDEQSEDLKVQLSNYTYRSGRQDWGSYCGYNCMTDRLKDISNACGYTLKSIGKSVQGRDIWVVETSSKPTALMGANIHGDEKVGGQILQRWLWETCFEPTTEQRTVLGYGVAYMPMANPDGYERGRRWNANGRDLNRDFPEPGESDSTSGRQAETRAYMKYVSDTPSLKMATMYHGGAVVANYPYDACYRAIPGYRPCGNGYPPAKARDHEFLKELARAYTWPSSTSCLYGNCIINGADWYEIRGSSQDYNYYFKGIMDVTIEVSGRKNPSAWQLDGFYNDNYQAIYNFIQTGYFGK